MMLIVFVHVTVKEEFIKDFKTVSLKNAQSSIQEAGIARFDVVQQQDDPKKFVLIEGYRTAEAPARHKETLHYAEWRDAVADMMETPRFSVKYTNLFPDDVHW
jgi:quinol monooxygenase YgiN